MKIKEIFGVVLCVLIGGSIIHFSKKMDFGKNQDRSYYIGIQYLKGNFKNAPESDDSVYVYQGSFEKEADDSIKFTPNPDEAHLFAQRMLTLVYDINGVRDQELILSKIKENAKTWKMLGNSITSIRLNLNIDSKDIEEYYTFMEEISTLTKAEEEYNIVIGGINNWMALSNEQIAKIRAITSTPVFELYKDGELIDSLENLITRLSKIDSYHYISVKNGSLSKENLKLIAKNKKFAGIINVIE